MTKQGFAQELVLRSLIQSGTQFNLNEISPVVLTSIARIAKNTLLIAEAIEAQTPGFFSSEDSGLE